MELERQGSMERFAGDCPLEDADGGAERRGAPHRLPLCAMPKIRRSLFCVGLHPGQAGLSAGGRCRKGKPEPTAVGPVWDLLFTEKGLKQAR